ncbi:DNA-(apurinic or apyrimidinic site) endonuclease 2 isoform X2 [Phoenix dactylifera]|uniref:DNA-(apurinic or apyrimidinic site) endonuclease 2 n=1 Tax=Phoenix dactylifera TaxID=42345 RepID=A0A8B8J4G6_PHODC|nr:DNA-(apurinic or apyrimidinic site) endonuclease 2 isoform X2 [Phoenix dactylifera]
MKIVTYNVNGLRQRVSQHGSLLRLLNSLDADIICFQETKLSRQELSADVTMAEGYEAFVSCTRTSNKGRTGYSGVATFCRVRSSFSSNEVALPVAAEEGFTGLLECLKKREITRDFLHTPVEVEGLSDITNEDLLKVDSEGRCLITDHGHFVLFNIYGPRAEEDDKERIQFKLLFFRMLEKRLESLLTQGKRVFVAGDLNIAPAAIDKCDAEPGFEKNMFRKWLRSLLQECRGSFFDVFRSKHPERWNGGRSTKLEGSDHVPVYVVLRDIPDLSTHDTPSLAVRYFPEVRGWQQTIVSFLMKRKVSSNCKHHSLSNFSSVEDTLIENCGECVECSLACGTKSQHVNASDVSHSSGQDLPYFNSGGESFNSNVIKDSSITVDGTQNTLLRLKTEPARSLSHCKLKLKKKGGHSNSSQLTLTSFFQKPNIVRTIGVETVNTGGSSTPEDTEKPRDNLSHVTEGAGKIFSENVKDSSSERNDSSISSHVQEQGCSDPSFFYKKDKDNVAILEWQRIQEKMKKSLPLCKGHREPCVARSVKKGPNTGRQFYVCARAKGPASNQEANCDHFQWASVKSKENRR